MFFLSFQHYPESLYHRYYNANGELVEEEGLYTEMNDLFCDVFHNEVGCNKTYSRGHFRLHHCATGSLFL